MRVTLYTLFPGLITPYLDEALLARAIERGLLEVDVRDLRRFANTPTGRVDDAPYGGGAGMVIRVDVAAAAIAEVRAEVTAGRAAPTDEIVLLTPAGERLDQRAVERFAEQDHIVLLSGRYEGFDARVEHLVTREISVGDYVLMGGELPALTLIEAMARLLPGALGHAESHRHDSFSTGLLDHPEYTRPALHDGRGVPDVLLSGHHGKVAAWRREQALRRTLERRPDLLATADLDDDDRRTLERLRERPEP